MSEPVIEVQLTDAEASLLEAQTNIVGESSKQGASKAYAFARLLTDLVQAMGKGDEAQTEYMRIIKRLSKARSRQPEDVVDVNFKEKTITFKKTAKELAREKTDDDEDDAVPEGS